MGGVEQIVKKLESYDHNEYNTDTIKSSIAGKIANGEDYVGRKLDWQGKPFRFWEDMSGLPQYLIENKERWIKLFR